MGSDVVEVTSYGSRSKSKLFAPYEYPGTTVTILKFKNGAVGKCASSIDCLQPYYFHTHLVGSKGSLLDNKFHSADLGTNKAAWSTLAMKLRGFRRRLRPSLPGAVRGLLQRARRGQRNAFDQSRGWRHKLMKPCSPPIAPPSWGGR